VSAGPEPLIYHGVKVRWNDGRTEMCRYATEDQAKAAEHYQFVENWQKHQVGQLCRAAHQLARSVAAPLWLM